MRECNQKQCGFLQAKNGCRACSFCLAQPFIVSPDCPVCNNCENIAGNCRWDDGEQDTTQEETQKDEQEQKDKQEIVIEEKTQ